MSKACLSAAFACCIALAPVAALGAEGDRFCSDWKGWDQTRRARFIAVQADAALTRNYPDEAKDLLRCVQPLAVAGLDEVTAACDTGDYAAGFIAGFMVAASLAECVSQGPGSRAEESGSGDREPSTGK